MSIIDYLKIFRRKDKLVKSLNGDYKTTPATEKNIAMNVQNNVKKEERVKDDATVESQDHFAIFDAKLKELESLVFYDKKRVEELLAECEKISSLMDSAWVSRFKNVRDEVWRQNGKAKGKQNNGSFSYGRKNRRSKETAEKKQCNENSRSFSYLAPDNGMVKIRHAESRECLSEDDKFIEQYANRRVCDLSKHTHTAIQGPKNSYAEREEAFLKSIGVSGPRICDLDD